MEHKDAELGLLGAANADPRLLDVLLQLLDRVLQRRTGVVHLVHDQDVLAHQVLHLAQGAEVEPLGAGDAGAGSLNHGRAGDLGEGLVEREADGLDGDVGAAVALEEGAENAGGDVAAAADGDHEGRLHSGEDLGRSLLAELVDLSKWLSAGERHWGMGRNWNKATKR